MSIEKAAQMAGNWWAKKLNNQFESSKLNFSDFVKNLIINVYEGNIICSRDGEIISGNNHRLPYVVTSVDYEPEGIILVAVRCILIPKVEGYMFSAKNIFPFKHDLKVTPTFLEPKEGYENWTDIIKVEK